MADVRRTGRRTFTDAAGRPISERQYRKALGKAPEAYAHKRLFTPAGRASAEKREKYRVLIEDFRRAALVEGRKLSVKEAMADPELRFVTKTLRQADRLKYSLTSDRYRQLAKRGKGPLRPGGPLARALEILGRRAPESVVPVGES